MYYCNMLQICKKKKKKILTVCAFKGTEIPFFHLDFTGTTIMY